MANPDKKTAGEKNPAPDTKNQALTIERGDTKISIPSSFFVDAISGPPGKEKKTEKTEKETEGEKKAKTSTETEKKEEAIAPMPTRPETPEAAQTAATPEPPQAQTEAEISHPERPKTPEEKADELLRFLRENKDKEFDYLVKEVPRGTFAKIKNWMNTDHYGRATKLGLKVAGATAAIVAAGALTGGAALWATPLLVTMGRRELVSSAVEGIQYFTMGGARRRSQIMANECKYEALKKEIHMRVTNETAAKIEENDIRAKIMEVQALVSEINRQEKEFVQWEMKNRKIRGAISTVATIGISVMCGIPMGLQNFDKGHLYRFGVGPHDVLKTDVAHEVRLTTRGFEFLYNKMDTVFQGSSHAVVSMFGNEKSAMGGLGAMLVGLAIRTASEFRNQEPKNKEIEITHTPRRGKEAPNGPTTGPEIGPKIPSGGGGGGGAAENQNVVENGANIEKWSEPEQMKYLNEKGIIKKFVDSQPGESYDLDSDDFSEFFNGIRKSEGLVNLNARKVRRETEKQLLKKRASENKLRLLPLNDVEKLNTLKGESKEFWDHVLRKFFDVPDISASIEKPALKNDEELIEFFAPFVEGNKMRDVLKSMGYNLSSKEYDDNRLDLVRILSGKVRGRFAEQKRGPDKINQNEFFRDANHKDYINGLFDKAIQNSNYFSFDSSSIKTILNNNGFDQMEFADIKDYLSARSAELIGSLDKDKQLEILRNDNTLKTLLLDSGVAIPKDNDGNVDPNRFVYATFQTFLSRKGFNQVNVGDPGLHNIVTDYINKMPR